MDTPPPVSPPPPPKRHSLLATPAARLVLIACLLALLAIPAQLIRAVLEERQGRRDEAVGGITSAWGGTQSLFGPVLRLPFRTRQVVRSPDGKAVETVTADAAYLLPEALNVQARLMTELRRRGLFEVPVYVADLELEGRFRRPDLSRWNVRPEDVDWAQAELILSLGDASALHADARLLWQGAVQPFRPASGSAARWPGPAIHAALGEALRQPFAGELAPFRISLRLNGAGGLYFAPAAEETQVHLVGDWPHPSFQGHRLPQTRQVKGGGFAARWSVSYLGRDYPQQWRESTPVQEALTASLFGARLDVPVDPYALAHRISRYALLIMVFTFAVLWLAELLTGRCLHPIQYVFVGGGLCLFGLLQLAMAEHLGFTVAFAAAAAAVTAMITLYCRSLLASARRALAVGAVLCGLYVYLWTLLQAEDYALLGGALGLFLALASAMYLTRNINWSAPAVQGGGSRDSY